MLFPRSLVVAVLIALAAGLAGCGGGGAKVQTESLTTTTTLGQELKDLSVWQTGLAGQRVSRSNAEWRKEVQETLPDLREEDIAGSGFAITGYTVDRHVGGDAALARLLAVLRQPVVAISWTDLEGHGWQLRDRMGAAMYEKSGGDLAAQGLYLDMPA
jgi:hypothetical protein